LQAAKKNQKRKDKKKVNVESDQIDLITDLTATTSIRNSVPVVQNAGRPVASAAAGSVEDLTKKLRNLNKKLKQIVDLSQQISSGEIAQPEKEQFAKISRRAAIESEIEDLELELEKC